MKKILSIAFAALLVLGFAASAFAIHAEIPAETQAVVAKSSTQITLGGELRLRGWYRNNITYAGQRVNGDHNSVGAIGEEAASQSWYDYRIRISLEAKVTPNLIGFIQLETDGDSFDITNDKYTFGQGLGNSGFSNAKPASHPDYLQAWILYQGTGLFGFNSGIKVGHMPLSLSHKQFYDHTQMGDDALVFFMDPTKDLHIGLLTIKLDEGFHKGSVGNARFDNTNDVDAYVALMTYTYKTHKFGINYTYVNFSDGFTASSDPGFENHNGVKMSNVGLHAEGTVGNFGYAVEGDIQFGSQDTYIDCDTDPVTLVTTCEGDQKHKYRGWALFVKANYKINTVNLRGMFAYGSGDNDATDNKIKEFVPFVGNVQNYSFIYEYQHRTTAADPSGMNPAAPSNGHAGGIANTTVYNLGVDWQATKDLGLSLDGYIFRASKVGHHEDVVNDDVSKSAGWEVDFKGKYQVAKNLSYQVDLGYYKPGGFYEDRYGIDKKGVTALRHTLTLSF